MILGCDGPIVKRALPAPPRQEVKASFQGKIYRMWGGDNFEFGQSHNLHYVLLRGVDAPDPGQPFYNESKLAATQLTRGKLVDVQVIDRDEVMREIADVVVPVGKTKGDFEGDRFSLGVELIRRGLARYNPEGFAEDDRELAAKYIAAEELAKKTKVGIWQPVVSADKN